MPPIYDILTVKNPLQSPKQSIRKKNSIKIFGKNSPNILWCIFIYMKIIITENQNVLLRRYQVVKDEVLKQMGISNPCYYNDYFDFNKYKSDIIHSSINEIVGDLGIDERSLDHFRNELSSYLNGVIRRYYNKFIKENCRPRW
jgi:hypothetical protein